jgi:tetratricopeptide (TPR) repeat protein
MSETETLLKFGWYSFSQGKWQEAISYFEKGLAKLPNDNKPTNVLYGLARMYENTGNKTKAIETYRQLLSIMKDKEPEIQMVQTRILSLEEKIEQ